MIYVLKPYLVGPPTYYLVFISVPAVILGIFLSRVLLAKWPDMWEPNFLGQYLFVCIIKSTYQLDVPGTKIVEMMINNCKHFNCNYSQRQFWKDWISVC